MLFGTGLKRARGREISNSEKRTYYKREALQTDCNEICGALEVLTEQMQPAVCDDYFYELLENSYEDHRRKSRRNWSPVLIVWGLCGFAVIRMMKGFSQPRQTGSPSSMLLLSIAVILLVYIIFRKKRNADRLKRVRECIIKRENITAYTIRIDELVWHDNSDSESTEYVPYLRGGNIIFRVTDDIFNNASPGEYFTAAIVNTGREKMFFLL